ncbi:hypothetical protein FOL47_009484 [Perkinsus chesapeaki]|uniref:N-acetyltransferase domain-containing protein n=1 Tax=Perkinsus chesapeaki TaxID=330153 RepID=A0A7J6L814_PERCH|nr:hypothetical protein FOL47_009484 [Perkinsus chesapeaki]
MKYFNYCFFILSGLVESKRIIYRSCEKRDTFYKQSALKLYCQEDTGGIPCYVAVDLDAGPNAVVGFITITIPYDIPELEESDVRKMMPGDKKRKGIFGTIECFEVYPDYRGQGIGAELLQNSINHGTTTPNFLAMTVHVLRKDARAMGLYKRYDFVEVFKDENYFHLARYY